MIHFMGHMRGVPETQAILAQAIKMLLEEFSPAVRESLFLVSRTAQQNYLSGPRPQKLGVISNRLRGSISEHADDNIFRIQQDPVKIVGTIGTNVEYGPIHEYGLPVRTKHGSFRMPKRPFMAPAEKDSTPAVLKRLELANTAAEFRLQALLEAV